MRVGELLGAATVLLDDPVQDTETVWPLGAAVLIRQAIEGTVERFWLATAPAMQHTTFADQLASLPVYLGHAPELAAAEYAWSALSSACHQRGYDVGLTQEELRTHHAAALAFARLVAERLEARAS